MSADGWVKLWRQLLDSDVFANAELLRVFVWCLLKAGFVERHFSMRTGRGATEVTAGPGQFIFGRKAAGRELALPESTLYERMQKLAAMDCIDIQPGTHFSIVTIVNWDIFQGSENESRQATGHPTGAQPTNKRQASDTTKKSKNGENVKNVEKDETDGRARARFSFSWNEATARETLALAARVDKALGGAVVKPGNRFNDRRTVLAASLAVVNQAMPESWLMDATERTRAKRPKNVAAALTAELKRSAEEQGSDFSGILRAADNAIPPGELARHPKSNQTAGDGPSERQVNP